MRCSSRTVWMVGLVIFLTGTVDFARGQTPAKQSFVGPVSSAPEVLIGISAGTIHGRGTGIYADLKVSPSVGYGYDSVVTTPPRSSRGIRVRQNDRWISTNLGFTYSVYPKSFAFVAVGVAHHRRYTEYSDSSPSSGRTLTYRTLDDESYRLSVTAGIGYRYKSVLLYTGLDSAPRGVVLGVSYLIGGA